MQHSQPHNVVMFEVEIDGALRHFLGAARTPGEDAVRTVWEELRKHGIAGAQVRRIYSERQPSPETETFIAETFLGAAAGWKYPRAAPEAAISAGLTQDVEQARQMPRGRFVPVAETLKETRAGEQSE
ncbi:MAG: hypothetical protein L0Y70_07745 [Gemmataceae bacterium]|nr:hypothetical protein [Gemmataceae bacterium]